MSATYLLRFDDLHPAMRWTVWDQVEEMLDDAGIRPLVAIIPSNRDATLDFEEPRTDFWERVHSWRQKGWALGLHGFEHQYCNEDPGLIGLRTPSEFAGEPADRQQQKIAQGLEVFRSRGLEPDLFIAPGHTFDATTVATLRQNGVGALSDGWSIHPFEDEHGVVWVPQQLWRFRWRPFGVWTVCLHHNMWTPRDLDRFRTMVEEWGPRVADPIQAIQRGRGRRRSPADRLAEVLLPRWTVGRERLVQLLRRSPTASEPEPT